VVSCGRSPTLVRWRKTLRVQGLPVTRLHRDIKRDGFSDDSGGQWRRGALAVVAVSTARSVRSFPSSNGLIPVCSGNSRLSPVPLFHLLSTKSTIVASLRARNPREPRENPHPRWRSDRIGQGASSSTTDAVPRLMRCSEAGYETIMVNCNPGKPSHGLRDTPIACTPSAHRGGLS